jgi:sorbitol-specific phosphotransferase system component IIA
MDLFLNLFRNLIRSIANTVQSKLLECKHLVILFAPNLVNDKFGAVMKEGKDLKG